MQNPSENLQNHLEALLLYKNEQEEKAAATQAYCSSETRKEELHQLLLASGFEEADLERWQVVKVKRFARWQALEQQLKLRGLKENTSPFTRPLLEAVLRLDPFNQHLLQQLLQQIASTDADYKHWAERYLLSKSPQDLDFEKEAAHYQIDPSSLSYDYWTERITAPLIEDILALPKKLSKPEPIEGIDPSEWQAWNETATELSPKALQNLERQLQALKEKERQQGSLILNPDLVEVEPVGEEENRELQKALRLRPFDAELLRYALREVLLQGKATEPNLSAAQEYLQRYRTSYSSDRIPDWTAAQDLEDDLGAFIAHYQKSFNSDALHPLMVKYYPHPALLFYQAHREVLKEMGPVLKPTLLIDTNSSSFSLTSVLLLFMEVFLIIRLFSSKMGYNSILGIILVLFFGLLTAASIWADLQNQKRQELGKKDQQQALQTARQLAGRF